jgi:hypothetical protein
MLVYYDAVTGYTAYAVYDYQKFNDIQMNTMKNPAYILVDEIEENRGLCRELYETAGKTDKNGNHKYTVISGEIYKNNEYDETYYSIE